MPSVLANHSQGAHLAAEHLSSLGHQNISYVAGPVRSWADGSRWHALQNAAADLHLHVRRLGPFMPTVGGGCDAAAQLAITRTSAVITYNDYLALGMMHRLAQDGIRVPDEVSIVGFGDIPAARLVVTPSLTTIAAPTRAQGVVAVHYLLTIIKAPDHSRTNQQCCPSDSSPDTLQQHGSSILGARRANGCLIAAVLPGRSAEWDCPGARVVPGTVQHAPSARGGPAE